MTAGNGRPAAPASVKAASRSYRGPAVVLTRAEAQRVLFRLRGSDEPLDQSVIAKCAAALNSDPAWLEPLK